MGARRSILFLFIALLISQAGECDTVEHERCETLRATAYEALYNARDFSFDWITSKDATTPIEVQALRCMTGEAESISWLRSLLQRGTLPGQLYGLVGLRALDHQEFNKVISHYKSNETPIARRGGDIAVSHPAATIAAAIERGGYVREFLPALKSRVPEDKLHIEMVIPEKK